MDVRRTPAGCVPRKAHIKYPVALVRLPGRRFVEQFRRRAGLVMDQLPRIIFQYEYIGRYQRAVGQGFMADDISDIVIDMCRGITAMNVGGMDR